MSSTRPTVGDMDSPTTPLLLIGGAGLPAWAWDDVRAALPAGHPTAVAARPAPGGPRTLDDYARAALGDAPWPSFVAVAHSIGGVIATRIVEQAPDRVLGVVGIAALFPPPGRSFLGALPFPQRAVLGAVMRVLGTRPPASALRNGLAPGLDDAVVERLVADFVPESQELYRDAVGRVAYPPARGYLRTSDDPQMPLALQDRSAATLGAGQIETLPTGHVPMLADPDGVAGALGRLLAPDRAAFGTWR
jgi:pimeloyl-ACP methyl ester carboxylesterase